MICLLLPHRIRSSLPPHSHPILTKHQELGEVRLLDVYVTLDIGYCHAFSIRFGACLIFRGKCGSRGLAAARASLCVLC